MLTEKRSGWYTVCKLRKFTYSIFSQKFRQITVLCPTLHSILLSLNIFQVYESKSFVFYTVRYVVVGGLSTSILFRQNGYFWSYIFYLWYRLTSEKYPPVRMKAVEYRMYLHILHFQKHIYEACTLSIKVYLEI